MANIRPGCGGLRPRSLAGSPSDPLSAAATSCRRHRTIDLLHPRSVPESRSPHVFFVSSEVNDYEITSSGEDDNDDVKAQSENHENNDGDEEWTLEKIASYSCLHDLERILATEVNFF